MNKAMLAMSIVFADLSVNLDAVAGIVALVTAISLAAVAIWRISSLEHRVEFLEGSDRNHAERMVAVETKLENIEDLCRRIADKLNVSSRS